MQIDVLLNHKPVAVRGEGDRVLAVSFEQVCTGGKLVITNPMIDRMEASSETAMVFFSSG
jgi:hypothetical protein